MRVQFSITSEPICPSRHLNPEAGAVVTFEGLVRNHNNGREVQGLFYDSYRELAEKEGLRILEDVIGLFDIHSISAIHRVGPLDIGEAAIWLQVQASHRHAAFEAAGYAMDRIKKSVPIWKKEDYTDQGPEWLPGFAPGAPDKMFLRQTILPEVGQTGQAKLANTSVLVVGAGGLGTPAIEYLVRAGIGHITVIDPDSVDESNLGRQTAYLPSDVGRPKVSVLQGRYRSFESTKIDGFAIRVQDASVVDLVVGHDIVLDCTDDIEAKYLLNDTCLRCRTPLVSASIHRWQGQVFVVDGSPCMRCMQPIPPPQACVGTCQEEGVVGSLAGAVGAIQANEAVKLALGLTGVLTGRFLAIDLLDGTMLDIVRGVSDRCPNCGSDTADYSAEDVEIDLDSLRLLSNAVIVDVRSDRNAPFPDAIASVPVLASLEEALAIGQGDVVLVCNRGNTSLKKTYQLRDAGHPNVYSLRGGLGALSGHL